MAALLVNVHRKIGFLEVLVKYAPNKEAFAELMLLKKCIYSRMIDYDSLAFKEVLTSRRTGKSDITPITNLQMVYKAAEIFEINAPDLSRICGIALYGESEDNSTGDTTRMNILPCFVLLSTAVVISGGSSFSCVPWDRPQNKLLVAENGE